MDCVHRQTGAEAELDARQGVGGAAAHLLLLSAPRGLNEQSCFHKWEFHFTVSSLHQHFPNLILLFSLLKAYLGVLSRGRNASWTVR